MLTRKRKRELKKLIPRLPPELWEMVADQVENSVDWLNLILTVPMLVSYSLRVITQEKMKTKFTIVSIRDSTTKVMYRLPNGALHNTNGPAIISYREWDIDYHRYKHREMWYKDNIKHREDGPAITEYFSDGKKQMEIWCVNGKQCNKKDYPIEIRYYQSGNKSQERWVAPRLNSEATEIHYHENGKKTIEYWWSSNAEYACPESDFFTEHTDYNGWRGSEYIHKENSPGIIYYYPDGQKQEEYWIEKGINWRVGDLPSWTSFWENGTKKIEQWTLKSGKIGRENRKSYYIGYNKYGAVVDPGQPRF